MADLTPSREALDAMAGTLSMTGQKRNRVYAYGAYINILNQETS